MPNGPNLNWPSLSPRDTSRFIPPLRPEPETAADAANNHARPESGTPTGRGGPAQRSATRSRKIEADLNVSQWGAYETIAVVTDQLYMAVVDLGVAIGVDVRMITSADAVQHFTLPPANPNKPIRFGVGQPGRRSSVWRLWANKQKDDVYLATRHSAGVFKISLHESGDWRLQWVGRDSPDPGDVTFTPLDDSPRAGRVLHQWSRPPSDGPGWTDAVSLWVPSEDVQEIPCDSEPGHDAQWLVAPRPGDATEFRLLLVEPAEERVFNLTAAVEQPHSSFGLVNGFRLASGTAVLLTAATSRLHDSVRDELGKVRDKAAANVSPEFDLAAHTGPRTLPLNTDDRGRLNFWDLSLPTQ